MENKVGKRRLLLLLQLLLQQTDEEHPLSTLAIIEYFDAQGIATDRKTVKADVEILTDAGYDIVTTRGKQNQYFIGTRDFEVPEVKLLIDAVYASRFITPAKSKALIEKLSTLVSTHQAEHLSRRMYISDRIKPVNETIYYSSDIIRTAMSMKRQIRFQYYEYTPKKQKILKHKGKVYCFSPYDLIWNEDRYYVLGFSKSYNKVISFRVDRMCDVQISDRAIIPPAKDYSVAAYGSKIFDMFDGKEATVVLSCRNEFMKVIIDRFGEDVQTETRDKEHFFARVTVSVSPTFYGWVFQFAGGIQITSPAEILHEYRAMMQYQE